MTDKMKNILTEVNSAKEEYEAAVKSVSKKVEKSLQELVADTDGLVAIRWAQYTPHFNDGDACEFSVHEPYFKFEDTGDDAGDYEDGFISSYDLDYDWDNASRGKRYKTEDHAAKGKLMESIESVFGEIDDKIFLNLFDDGYQVTVNENSTEVEDFDHD